MIIKYPTGLYNLFESIDDAPNITWYISNNTPPRSKDVTIKIPPSEEIRQIPISPIDRKVRRKAYGDLIYSINEINNKIANSSKKQYGEGDVLDFAEDNRDDLSIPRGKRVEYRHDLNELDMESVGLDEDDIAKFNSDVYDKKEELENQYLLMRQDIEDIEINIKETQKKINESNKALDAVKILGDLELENKIVVKRSQYINKITELSAEHDQKSIQVAAIVDDLFKIDMVAR